MCYNDNILSFKQPEEKSLWTGEMTHRVKVLAISLVI